MTAVATSHLHGHVQTAQTVHARAAYDAQVAARQASARAAQAGARAAALQLTTAEPAWTPDPRRAAERTWLARNRARAALVRLADAHERAAVNCDALGLSHAAMHHRIAAAVASDRIDGPRNAAEAPPVERESIDRQTGTAEPARLTVAIGRATAERAAS